MTDLPGNGKNAPMISWGEDYKKWDDAHKIEYLEKLSSSLNHALDLMQQERNISLSNAKDFFERLDRCQESLDIQKAAVLKNITDTNAERQNFINELQTAKQRNQDLEKIIDGLQN